MTPTVVLQDNPSAQCRAALMDLMLAYNESKTGPSGFAPFALVLNDPTTGDLIGGLWGRTVYDWMIVELLIVPERLRGHGLGTELLRRAEEVAVARGCIGVYLDSFDFQAPGFYRKHGYEEIAALDSPRYAVKRRLFAKRLALT
jgi:GNAT superfamily N-acetyltransferase